MLFTPAIILVFTGLKVLNGTSAKSNYDHSRAVPQAPEGSILSVLYRSLIYKR